MSVFFDGWLKHGEQWQDQQDNHRDQQNRAGETDGICDYAVQCRRYRVRTDSNSVKEPITEKKKEAVTITIIRGKDDTTMHVDPPPENLRIVA